ncbi:hypothetical protein [Streptomyces cyaneofuscatus]|uniref:hypothetical protein n=1 Tax=Streptomyces cyaneofuscatus TaxID=66883 RepID=UPI00365A240D
MRTTPPPTPDVLLSRVLGGLFEGAVHGPERRTVASLIVRVGSETLRGERLAALLEEGYAGTRIVRGRLFEAYRGAGILPEGVPDDHVVPTVIATPPWLHRAGGAPRGRPA